MYFYYLPIVYNNVNNDNKELSKIVNKIGLFV
jgi:hypothetical protein